MITLWTIKYTCSWSDWIKLEHVNIKNFWYEKEKILNIDQNLNNRATATTTNPTKALPYHITIHQYYYLTQPHLVFKGHTTIYSHLYVKKTSSIFNHCRNCEEIVHLGHGLRQWSHIQVFGIKLFDYATLISTIL